MTQQEWLVSTDIWAMLWCAKFGDRKNRLFSCACCRHIWHLITDPRSRKAVEVAELYADGLASGEELSIARNDAWKVWRSVEAAKATAASVANSAVAAASAAQTSAAAACPAAGMRDVIRAAAQRTERAWQISLLKHLTNPFEILTFKHTDTTIDNLALALYNQEPCHYALHDALMEEGCLFAEHFKEEYHPKGCLYLDYLLGKIE